MEPLAGKLILTHVLLPRMGTHSVPRTGIRAPGSEPIMRPPHPGPTTSIWAGFTFHPPIQKAPFEFITRTSSGYRPLPWTILGSTFIKTPDGSITCPPWDSTITAPRVGLRKQHKNLKHSSFILPMMRVAIIRSVILSHLKIQIPYFIKLSNLVGGTHSLSNTSQLKAWSSGDIPNSGFPSSDAPDSVPPRGSAPADAPIDPSSSDTSKTIFVDDNAPAGGDGTSWASAHKYLQDALVVAENGDEIWVAEGTYKPDQGAGITEGNRTASFNLVNGVGIYGGFLGIEVTR